MVHGCGKGCFCHESGVGSQRNGYDLVLFVLQSALVRVAAAAVINHRGQCDVPENFDNVTQIAAKLSYTCGIDSVGQLVDASRVDFGIGQVLRGKLPISTRSANGVCMWLDSPTVNQSINLSIHQSIDPSQPDLPIHQTHRIY